MSNDELLLLNLDDTLTWQGRLLAFPHAWVDLRQVEGKKSCATPESLATIAAAVRPYRRMPLCFLGAGDYHYVTLPRLQALQQPVTLVLFDHHHDCAPVQGGVITCGDWVRHALDLPWVRQVIWVGGKRPELWSFRPHRRLLRMMETDPPGGFAAWAAQAIPTRDLYISIDKDVLAPDDGLTNWGAGDLPLAHLLAWIERLGQHRRVIGADVCGEWALAPSQLVPSLQDRRAIRLNEGANLAIIQALAPALYGHSLAG